MSEWFKPSMTFQDGERCFDIIIQRFVTFSSNKQQKSACKTEKLPMDFS